MTLAWGVNRTLNAAKKTAGIVSIAMLLAAVSPPLFSQSAVGTILGGVFDSSGGAIAGAKVTIIDVARGTTRALTTDDSGKYTAPTLLSGTYTVRAEASGFSTAEQTNVLLEVAQNVRVDLTLSLGEQTQIVTVTEEIPAIDVTSATLGGTVTNQSLAALPLVTRNFLQLLQLRPGVVDTPGGKGNNTVTNGRRQGADVLLIEGVTQFDLATSNVLINGAQQGGSVSVLPVDSIQEFSTQQNPPAEYGWRDGSAVNVGIKSGTNAIHGTAYAFGRNAVWLDAKTFDPTGKGKVDRLSVAQPGFTLGGPILKNKLFWFVSAEFIRQSVINTAGVTVPTDVPGLGASFSMVDACNAVGRANVNPLSAQIAGLPPGSCIPQPATETFENLFPYNPTNSQIIFPNPATTSSSNNGLAKIDWNPSEHHHLSSLVYISKATAVTDGSLQPYWGLRGIGSTSEYAGSWTYAPNSSWVNDLRGGAAPNTGTGTGADVDRLPADPYPVGYSVNTGVSNRAFGSFPNVTITSALTGGLGQPMQQRGKRGPQYQLDFSDKVSHLFGNHSLKFGYETVFVRFDNSSTGNTNGAIGFTSLQNFLTGNVNTATIITGNVSVAYRERWHAAFIQDTWRISPRVTLTPGIRWEYIGSPHSIDNRLANFDPTQPGGVVQTGPGLPNSTQIHAQKTNFNPRMGVAWDIFGNGKTVLRGGIGNLSSFPAILTITGGQNTTAPFGATLCAGPATPNTAVSVSCAGSNMIINRYGTAANAGTVQTLSPGTTIAPNWTTTCTNPLITSTCNGPALFPVSSAVSATSGPTCTASSPCSMLPVDPNFKNPKSLQWNLDIQRALTNNLTLDVAYVGTHGYDEAHTVDLNQPPNGTGWNTPWTAAQLAAQTGSAASKYSTGLANVGLTSAQICLGQGVAADAGKCKTNTLAVEAARPYASQFPYYQYINQTTNGFYSNYNGLQVTLNARNYHGLSFLTAYTYSHALDQWTKSSQATVALVDPANPEYQYGSSDFDVRHRLRLSPTYAIPGIKSPGQMLEGWSISAIWAWQNGFPWSATDQTRNDWAGNGENFNVTPTPNNGVFQTWNYSGPPSAFNGNGINPIPCYGVLSGCTPFASAPLAIQQACQGAAQAPYAGNQMNQQLALKSLANNACYIQNGGILTPPAYGTIGSAARGIFTGPRYQNVDVTVGKLWHVGERYSAQLRFECYNVFNHVSFAQFANNKSDPSSGGGVVGVAGFGYATTAQGSQRQFQFGLKLTF